mmetsp:Transcript_11308/g.30460  ORF Transcript_11308/g.30460 Transcript_11308/m.30460 type:complete len:110 (+) Transcript_11308:121-450(+)
MSCPDERVMVYAVFARVPSGDLMKGVQPEPHQTEQRSAAAAAGEQKREFKEEQPGLVALGSLESLERLPSQPAAAQKQKILRLDRRSQSLNVFVSLCNGELRIPASQAQ